MDNFYSSLAIGKRGEQMVADALTARKHIVKDVSDDLEYRRKDIDYVLINQRGQQTTLEIKNDTRSESTNNFFVETYNSNNKSHSYKGWFYYCEAEYICFLQENNRKAYIVSLDELKDNIDANNYRAANSSNARGFLMPIATLQGFNSFFCMAV